MACVAADPDGRMIRPEERLHSVQQQQTTSTTHACAQSQKASVSCQKCIYSSFCTPGASTNCKSVEVDKCFSLIQGIGVMHNSEHAL